MGLIAIMIRFKRPCWGDIDIGGLLVVERRKRAPEIFHVQAGHLFVQFLG